MMNKSALKTFATNARRELLKKVEARAMKIGISEDNIKKAEIESSDAIFIDGRQLSKEERNQRDRLIDRIKQIGFKRVIEEVAYTWFNRFTALRFMEVNDYLPTKVRVLSSTNAESTEPDMMKEALSLDLDVDKELVYELKMNNKSEELFKYLIIKHCNDLNRFMPFMFEKIDDYTEILFPDGLLATDSFIRHMTNTEVILEDSWEKIEVIGWLYQYYIAEEKDQVFADLKKNIKITKDTLPAATQLFTPNWIVRYMVENSLGRIWLESYPESHLKLEWKYYLDEAKQDENVIKQLEEIRSKNVNPEEITFLDPCCGSGHILVYAFDVFYKMYLEKGYVETEIPQLILEKNLYGLDVDDRAAQLASFAVMMKAREKSRRIFRREIQPNVFSIKEGNWLNNEIIDTLIENVQSKDEKKGLKEVLENLKYTFEDAKEYGSIIDIDFSNLDLLEGFLQEKRQSPINLFSFTIIDEAFEKLPLLIKQAKLLINKYDVVCTNPPYMGNGGMNKNLSEYLKKHYPNSKLDLSTVFMEKTLKLCKKSGKMAMINIPTWMFLSSYENLRGMLIEKSTILNLLHFGRGIFGSDFGSTAFVISNSDVSQYKAVFRKLFQKQGAVDSVETKEKWFFENMGRYVTIKENFINIPGKPIAYWLSYNFIRIFEVGVPLGDLCRASEGVKTGDNTRFLRYWHEVNGSKFSFARSHDNFKWYPHHKGGEFRKWYGNLEWVINWENDGLEIKNSPNSGLQGKDMYFTEMLCWSKVTSKGISLRYIPKNCLFDSGSPAIRSSENMLYYLGFINSSVGTFLLNNINPTINLQVGDVKSLPIIFDESNKSKIEDLVGENISISKSDWDSFENSWDFKLHPIIDYSKGSTKIESAFKKWEYHTENRLKQLKRNEEELNRRFIEIYSLQNEMISEINDKDITIHKANLERDIKSFISYVIGCSFGRYSLDEEGMVFAGGDFNLSRYKTFPTDKDNILPILPGAYFEDNIVSRFIDFVRITYGEETLNENLDFVADALGRKKGETAKETLRRYFLNDFYKDHVQTYKKRPIYWLFTSGKEKAFNCLIYMHRYDKTTLSRIRTDYLHDYQIRLDAEKKDLLDIIDGDSTAKEISNAKKELKSLEKKIDELKAYDELLHHMADMQIELDLDDGVNVNYEKFKGLVAKI
jgi:hypothetical protein